jgi:hypothetical protein
MSKRNLFVMATFLSRGTWCWVPAGTIGLFPELLAQNQRILQINRILADGGYDQPFVSPCSWMKS